MITKFASNKSALLRTCATGVIAAFALTAPAQAIVPNDNFTPDEIIDEEGGVNGVGQFFRNDGFVCSGTLINPRAVLFAAHCVNDRPESDYGPVVQSAFSFNVNALPGFQFWIRNGFVSNPDLFVYNINQIFYDPRSVARPEALGFLEADIAVASLDTPASNIPTWALLFSPLPDPGEITRAAGTGYHVNITGYGRSGNGSAGDFQGIDFRRRAAENFLGSLTSLDRRNQFLFGGEFGDLPQVLYSTDFDDPTRTDDNPSTTPNPFDFNLFKDDPLLREATTAGGDSGGPLILDAANNTLADFDLQLGVLSGGSRFFGPQGFSTYGTQSFYQPLFLFWDYIAAVNPYRYVSAQAGDGDWEDASRWVSLTDPNYFVINDAGEVVNGAPTAAGAGINGTQPQFGQVCFDQFDNEGVTSSECEDLSTGDSVVDDQPVPPDGDPEPQVVLANAIGRVNFDALTAGGDLVVASESAESAVTAAAPVPAAAEDAAIVTEVAVDVAAVDAPVVATPVAAEAASPGVRAGMIHGSEHQAHNNGVEMAINAPHTGVTIAEEAPHNGVDMADDEAQDDGKVDTAEEEAQANAPGDPGFAATPLPAPTIENGLAGATGFVPDNLDPADGENGPRRYFDVTLGAAGTTTLNTDVTIDRLTIAGQAGLIIADDASLTSLIDVTQLGGRNAINGDLVSNGDYSLISGVLSGNGAITLRGRRETLVLQEEREANPALGITALERVTTQVNELPALTSIMGAIAPGAMGTVGTLTVNGNVVLASGNSYMVDIGANGISDRLQINPGLVQQQDDSGAPVFDAMGDPVYVSDFSGGSGVINVGGTVFFNPVAGFDSFQGATYRIVQSSRLNSDANGAPLINFALPSLNPDGTVALDANGDPTFETPVGPAVTGAFDRGVVSAILLADFTYGTNFVDATIRAQSFQNVIDPNDPNQVAFAGLLDRNRGNEALRGLFQTLDFTDADTIQGTFNGFAPVTESTVQSLARGMIGSLSDHYQNRLAFANRTENAGRIAVAGNPVQLAALSLGGFGTNGAAGTAVMNDAATNAAQTTFGDTELNENVAVYLAGGFINGDGGSMPLANPPAGFQGEDEFDGFFIAGGVEYYLGERSLIGASVYYSDVEADVELGQQAESRAIMGSLYGQSDLTGFGLVLDARLSAGTLNVETLRNVGLGAQSFALTTDDDSFVYATEVGLTKEFDVMGAAIVAPGIRGRAAKVNFDNVTEQGGLPGLFIVRPDYESVQGLAGVAFRSKAGEALQLHASFDYVHEFLDGPNGFGANFAGGVGRLAGFQLVQQDRNWGEFGVGARFNTGNVSLDLNIDTTVGRSDVQAQVYSGALTFRF